MSGDNTVTLPEGWVDILPDELSLSSRTLAGDRIVFEWRVENGRRVPGAWIRISDTRKLVTRFACPWDEVHGEVLLTDDQSREFLRGQTPRLEWPAPFECPVTLRLAPDFDLTIDGLRRVKRAGFAARWTPERITLRDLRPEPMLRAGALPSVRYRSGHDDAVQGPTTLEIERAAIESAYTRDPSRAADREVSAVLPDEIGAISRAELFRGQRRADLEAAKTPRDRRPWRAAA